eukprot:1398999-Pyramimonas_sp.AAC.1
MLATDLVLVRPTSFNLQIITLPVSHWACSQVYTAAWFSHLDGVVAALTSRLGPSRIVLRLSRNCQQVANQEYQLSDGQLLFGPPVTGPVPFIENGVHFEADVINGQKTGTE